MHETAVFCHLLRFLLIVQRVLPLAAPSPFSWCVVFSCLSPFLGHGLCCFSCPVSSNLSIPIKHSVVKMSDAGFQCIMPGHQITRHEICCVFSELRLPGREAVGLQVKKADRVAGAHVPLIQQIHHLYWQHSVSTWPRKHFHTSA